MHAAALCVRVHVCAHPVVHISICLYIYLLNEGQQERNVKKVHKEDVHDFYSFLGEDAGSEKLQGCIG